MDSEAAARSSRVMTGSSNVYPDYSELLFLHLLILPVKDNRMLGSRAAGLVN